MPLAYIQHIINKGEGINVEFKSAKSAIPKNLFETVCAFLNRIGGNILLGVEDDGSISGIDEIHLDRMKKELTNALNNPQLINPPIYIIPEEIKVKKKTILHLSIFESSQVHNTRGLIFDRNNDGDYNITTNTNLVANLFIRKQSSFTENKIYPFATINELRPEIIQQARQMAVNRQPGHPWEKMSDMELLQSAQLYQKDYATGQEGITLAGILLFGRDDVILSVLPFHKTDAVCRIVDTNRYDDRDDIRTNLIESYDRLMRFVENHIPEKFVLKDDIRINVRNLIFREVIANTLIHREYTNPYPAKLIIEAGMVHTENANKAHGMEQLTPQRFTPFPKNPVIARVFKEIGRADELGSGVRNIFEYYKHYSDKKPLLEENDVFNCFVYTDKIEENRNVVEDVVENVVEDVVENVVDKDVVLRHAAIIKLIKEDPKTSATSIAEKFNVTQRTAQRDIEDLKQAGKILRIGPAKGGYWKIL